MLTRLPHPYPQDWLASRRVTGGIDNEKILTSKKMRKVSATSDPKARTVRDSSAEEGDDEGYDDVLSAYESEEGSKSLLPW